MPGELRCPLCNSPEFDGVLGVHLMKHHGCSESQAARLCNIASLAVLGAEVVEALDGGCSFDDAWKLIGGALVRHRTRTGEGR